PTLWRRLDDEEDQVRIGERMERNLDDAPTQSALRRVQTGRIDECDLALRSRDDPQNSTARALGLGGDDRQFGAGQSVEQRAFADIRRADQRRESAMAGTGRRASSLGS